MDNVIPGVRQALGKYIPSVILERFAREHAVVTEPVSEPVECALLFADIKGFTALTERLAAQGPAGVETLTGIINAYFSPLVDSLLDHGGDIVKFAGDALITIWPADDARFLDAAVLRAARAALAVQDAVAGYTTPTGEALGLKIAISAGRLHGAHLGGERGRWEFVLSGAPLTSVGLAADQCGPGEVVLQADAHALVEERTDTELRDDGVALLRGLTSTQMPITPPAQPDIERELEAALWTYVPGAIRSRVREGMDSLLGELRRVTVVFATLPGHDRGLPLAQSQELVLGLQRTLYRYEGSLNKLSVDDKGVSLLAALGLPPFAHDDDPARGVRVGLEMQAIFTEHGLQSRIGVASGRAFCGLVGSDRRCEYTMMGDVVNLAARLMVAATDGLLCDQPTYASASEQFEFDTLAPLTLKGKAEPVPVYRPLAERADRLRGEASEMVGRVAERQSVEAAIEAVVAGRSGVLTIEGEAGIGKSRLLREAHVLARGQCARLTGAADAVERTTPYQAWRGVFSWLCNLDGVSDPNERRAKALEAFGDDPDLGRLGPLLNALAVVELPDNDFTRDLSGEARADNTHDLAVTLLAKEARRKPLVVMLEDTHWMDSASWALLRRVVREVHPMLVVMATRPVERHQQAAEYRELTSLPAHQHLVLDALTPDEAVALVCRRLGVDALPEAARTLIIDKAGGNPFFSEELAKGMLEAGLIEIEDGTCRVASGVDLAEAALPDTVHGAVTQRIDRLAPTPQMVLKVASVIGRVFQYETLRDVIPITDAREHLEVHLQALLGLDVTVLEAPKPHLAYIFKHIITQEVAYELMLYSQRRELHRAVALKLETAHAGDLEGYLPLLAHHWRHAGDAERAIEYYERAGEQALRNHASEEAVEFFSAAMELGAESVDRLRRARWERRIGDAHYALGNFQRADQHLRRSLALAGYPFPDSLARLVLAQTRMSAVQVVHRVAPRVMTGRRGAERDFLLEVARADERVTQINYMRNDSVGTLFGGVRALNLAEAVGPSAELARTAANMSVIACICLLPRLARIYERLALETLKSIEDPACHSYVLEVTSIYRLGNAEWEASLERVNPAIDIAQRFGEHRRYEECALSRGSTWLRTGRLHQAGQQFDDLLASGERRDAPQVILWALGGRVGVDSFTGQHAGRVEQLRDALRRHGDDPRVLRADRVWANGLLAAALAQTDDHAGARAAVSRVLDNTDLLQMTAHYLLEGFDGAAYVALDLWRRQPDEAGELRAQAATLCTALRNLGITYPCARPHALLRRGELAALRGNRSRAVARWRRCTSLARELTMPAVELLAHKHLAEHLSGDEAASHRAAKDRLLAAVRAGPDTTEPAP